MMRTREKSDALFETFWDAYGRAYGGKVARIDAERAWKRLSAKDRRAALAGIDAYSQRCRRAGIAMKYAQGYLNGRRWEDSLAESVTPTASDSEEW